MKTLLIATVAMAAVPGLATAAEIRLKDAVAQVTIIPEARSDFAVTVVRGHPQLPQIRTTRTAGGVVVDGGLANRIRDCGMLGGVKIKNGPRVSKRELPQITVRAPLDFSIVAEGYVTGTIGAGRSISLTTEGCGGWTIGDTSRRLDIRLEGFGDVNAGRTRSASVALEGMGDVDIASVSGPVDASVEGMGDLRIKAGNASHFKARLEGMGSIRFGGVAGTVDATADGMGSIRVARATGAVRKSATGFSRVKIGD